MKRRDFLKGVLTVTVTPQLLEILKVENEYKPDDSFFDSFEPKVIKIALFNGEHRVSEWQDVTFGSAQNGAVCNDCDVRFKERKSSTYVNKFVLSNGEHDLFYGDISLPQWICIGDTAEFLKGCINVEI